MVQQVHERGHGSADFGVVIDPAHARVDLAFDGDLHLEAVAVHSRALVAGGQLGQGLGCLEAEVLDDAGAHGVGSCVSGGYAHQAAWQPAGFILIFVDLTCLAAAGVTYVMGVPGADDVMLAYQSTSFHDGLYARAALGKRPAPEFEAWMARMGIGSSTDAIPARLSPALIGLG